MKAGGVAATAASMLALASAEVVRGREGWKAKGSRKANG